jgi:hypothetical protein
MTLLRQIHLYLGCLFRADIDLFCGDRVVIQPETNSGDRLSNHWNGFAGGVALDLSLRRLNAARH